MSIRNILLKTLAVVVLLEVVLQALALGTSVLYAGSIESTGGGILCVGDSFTFGSGASSREFNYPNSLRRTLAEVDGIDVEVINEGWPGQNSADVLSRLDAQLRESKPRVVVCLIGVNDGWSRPDLVADFAGSTQVAKRSFRLELRLWRLISLMFRGQGTWAQNDETPVAQQVSRDQEPTAAMLEIGGVFLRRAGLSPGSREPYSRPKPPPGFSMLIQRCNELGKNYAAIRDLLVDRIDEFPTQPRAREKLIEAYLRLNRSDEAMRHIDELRTQHAENPRAESAEALLRSLVTAGLWGEAREVGTKVAEQFPDVPEIWRSLARVVQGDDPWLATVYYSKLIELVETPRLLECARIARFCAQQGDGARAALCFAAAALYAGNVERMSTKLRRCSSSMDESFLRGLLETEGLDSAGRALLEQMIVETFGEVSSEYLEVFRAHLVSIANLAATHGTRTVFASYPRSNRSLTEAQQAAALESGSGYAAVRDRFVKASRDHADEELFVSDGHCNDKGYALLARVVADVVAPLLTD